MLGYFLFGFDGVFEVDFFLVGDFEGGFFYIAKPCF
jgi:hypothetical protein